MWPHYATHVVSFLTIGIIWMNHHAAFDRIAVADRTLMVLNLLLLTFVTVIPYPTGLLADHLRVREASDPEVRRGRRRDHTTVVPLLPVDVIGVFVLLPALSF